MQRRNFCRPVPGPSPQNPRRGQLKHDLTRYVTCTRVFDVRRPPDPQPQPSPPGGLCEPQSPSSRSARTWKKPSQPPAPGPQRPAPAPTPGPQPPAQPPSCFDWQHWHRPGGCRIYFGWPSCFDWQPGGCCWIRLRLA